MLQLYFELRFVLFRGIKHILLRPQIVSIWHTTIWTSVKISTREQRPALTGIHCQTHVAVTGQLHGQTRCSTIPVIQIPITITHQLALMIPAGRFKAKSSLTIHHCKQKIMHMGQCQCMLTMGSLIHMHATHTYGSNNQSLRRKNFVIPASISIYREWGCSYNNGSRIPH